MCAFSISTGTPSSLLASCSNCAIYFSIGIKKGKTISSKNMPMKPTNIFLDIFNKLPKFSHLTIDQKGLSQYYHAFTSTTDSSIAQSVEQRTVNPCVPGSSPGRGAKIQAAEKFQRLFLYHQNFLSTQFIITLTVILQIGTQIAKHL